MDMITGFALTVVFAAAVLYVLYFVIRAAVRDGIQLARRSEDAER